MPVRESPLRALWQGEGWYPHRTAPSGGWRRRAARGRPPVFGAGCASAGSTAKPRRASSRTPRLRIRGTIGWSVSRRKRIAVAASSMLFWTEANASVQRSTAAASHRWPPAPLEGLPSPWRLFRLLRRSAVFVVERHQRLSVGSTIAPEPARELSGWVRRSWLPTASLWPLAALYRPSNTSSAVPEASLSTCNLPQEGRHCAGVGVDPRVDLPAIHSSAGRPARQSRLLRRVDYLGLWEHWAAPNPGLIDGGDESV